MSEQAHAPGESHHPGPLVYGTIAVILTVLTIFEITVFYMPSMQPVLVPVLIVLAFAKFALVAMFYMHLKFDSRVFSTVFVFPLIVAVTMGVSLLMLFEYLQHHLYLGS